MNRARLAAICGAAFAWSVLCHADTSETVRPIDGSRSRASFEVQLRLPMRAVGRFETVSGELRGSPERGWRVHVGVDGRGLRFDGPGWMERITRSEAFLALDTYPDIEFLSESVADALLHHGGELRGRLTLRGRQRDVRFRLLPATCARPGVDCELRVAGIVSRHDFGMNAYRFTVRDPVAVDFRVWLAPESPP